MARTAPGFLSHSSSWREESSEQTAGRQAREGVQGATEGPLLVTRPRALGIAAWGAEAPGAELTPSSSASLLSRVTRPDVAALPTRTGPAGSGLPASPSGATSPLLPALHPTPYLLEMRNKYQDFPGSPVVKTACCQCKEHGFDPWSVN